jgi:GTPase SAR1 family protein
MKIDNKNKEFFQALDIANNTSDNLFVTGRAGSGKSTFVQYLLKNTKKNYVVVAPTGVAAVNVGGRTIHSFFQLPIRPLLLEDKEIKKFNPFNAKGQVMRKIDGVIIDEVSMVRPDIIDAIDYSLRINNDNNSPFGGKQIIMSGDLLQIEPIVGNDDSEKQIISQTYNGVHFHKAKVFEREPFKTINFTKVYRQPDATFVNLLDKIRTGQIGTQGIGVINRRVVGRSYSLTEGIITLCSTNAIANNLNYMKLRELDGEEFIYNGIIHGGYPVRNLPAEGNLKLKVGAQVMITKNDQFGRWVNGTIATISKLIEDEIEVRLANGDLYTMEKATWEHFEYTYNKEEKKIDKLYRGSYVQYPIKLAWGITIHKSQGMTFDRICIDLGRGAFSSGQTYVGLSRVKSLNGLFLRNPIDLRDIIVSAEALTYYTDKCYEKAG